MTEIFIILLFSIGLWGVLASGNLIRKIIGLSLINSAVVMLFVLGGRIDGTAAPILTGETAGGAAEAGLPIVDPIPQALMLTAIVIGLSVTAVALILSIKLYEHHGSLEIEDIEESGNESSH